MSAPFIFTNSTPSANMPPSQSQPLMLQNFASTQGILGVDHVTFNNETGGLHKQVTFTQTPAAPVPTLPTDPPVLFTMPNILNGVPQLFYYSGSDTQSSTQYINALQGSTFLLGGIIIKWGSMGVPGPVTFASAFPNTCYVVLVQGTSAAYSGGWAATNILTNGFTANRTSGSGNTNYNYIAIGY
jgi:hypothetical protein